MARTTPRAAPLLVPAALILLALFAPRPARAVYFYHTGLDSTVAGPTSLAYDLLENPHVAYVTSGGLWYLKREGVGWKAQLLDPTASATGGVAIRIDGSGNPHVAYVESGSGDIKYTRLLSGAWQSQTVYSGAPATAPSLALTGAGEPRIAFANFNRLRYSRKYLGAWQTFDVDSGAPSDPSLALDAYGRARIAFHQASTPAIVYAQETSSSPSSVAFLKQSVGNGLDPSLALDSQGLPRIAYRLSTNNSLHLAEGSGAVGTPLSWSVELIQGGFSLGYYPSLALNGQGFPRVAYADLDAGSIRYAARVAGPGSGWDLQDVEGPGTTSPHGISLALGSYDFPAITYATTAEGTEIAEGGIFVGKISDLYAYDTVVALPWGGVGPIEIAVSYDGGWQWSTVLENVTRSPATFIAPSFATDAARVRIRRASDGAVAMSASTFRIVPPTFPPNPISFQRWSSSGAGVERRGWVSASAGDWNGDGYQDAIVGAPASDALGAFTGRAYIYFGGPSGDGVADVALTGEAAGDLFGYAVAGVGDVNGDGYDDVLVGAPFHNGFSGRAYVYYGGPAGDTSADMILDAIQAAEGFGSSVASAGDLNGDRYADLAVGSPSYDLTAQAFTDAGLVRVYFGGPMFDAVSDLGVPGSQAFEAFGTAVAGGGDLDGDGFDDLLAGAPFANAETGRAAAIFGGPSLDTAVDGVYPGSAVGERFGSALSISGDLNGDGRADAVIGAPNADGNRGRVAVFVQPGPPDVGSQPGPPDVGVQPGPPTLYGEAADDFLGTSVAGVGDVNGDGLADFAAGAPLNDARGSSAGRVYVVFGTTQLDMQADVVSTGAASGDHFGQSIALLGPSQCCGFGSILVGGDQGSVVGAEAGTIALFDFARYKVLSPKGGETWPVGALRDVRWLGSETATLELSVDGGATWTLLAENCGGQDVNQVSLRVPHAPSKFALVRVNPGPPDVGGQPGPPDVGGNPGPPDVGGNPGPPNGVAVSDSFFTIQTSVALLALLAAPAPEGKGAVLTWDTDPGPADLAGYRLERDTGQGFRTVAALLRGTTYTDAGAGAGATYRLYAVNGLGEEVLVGETSLAPRAPLAAWPLPYRSGNLSINFATFGGLGGGPGEAEVSLFDVSGRLVKRIAGGSYTAGRQAVVWDGRDERGQRVSSGIYFLKATSAGVDHKVKIAVLR